MMNSFFAKMEVSFLSNYRKQQQNNDNNTLSVKVILCLSWAFPKRSPFFVLLDN